MKSSMYVECGMQLVYCQLMSWPAAVDTHVERSKGGVTLSKGGVTLSKGVVTLNKGGVTLI